MNKTTNLILGAILAVLVISLLVGLGGRPTSFGGGGYSDLGYSGFTNASATVAEVLDTNENTVLAANSARQYFRIQNVGGVEVTLQLTSATTALAVTQGIILTATGTDGNIFEMWGDGLYKGQIVGMGDAASGTLSIIEK